jgi:hypothetical protein
LAIVERRAGANAASAEALPERAAGSGWERIHNAPRRRAGAIWRSAPARGKAGRKALLGPESAVETQAARK